MTCFECWHLNRRNYDFCKILAVVIEAIMIFFKILFNF
jgi:hypothetical protein